MRKIFLVICLFMIHCYYKNYVNAQKHCFLSPLNTSNIGDENIKYPFSWEIMYYIIITPDFLNTNNYSSENGLFNSSKGYNTIQKEINDGLGNNKINNRNLLLTIGNKSNTEPSKKYEHYISFSPKVGYGNLFNYMLAGSSINYRNKSILISADYFFFDTLFGFGSCHLLGISSGMRFIKNRLLFDLQIGTGINWHKRTGYNNTNSAIALNMKSALKYFPNNKFAIGVDALVSVNKLENLYALPLFSIEYGFMR